jgi:hypothetical protein
MAKYDPLAPVPETPAPETTVERIKRYAVNAGHGVERVGQKIETTRQKVEQFTQKPEVKKIVAHIKERGEAVGHEPRATPRTQPRQQKTTKIKLPKQPKLPKQVRRVQATHHTPPAHHPPPAYVVQNGQTLAAQMDPFGIKGGVIDNYQRLTAPKFPFGQGKKPPGGDPNNPFGIGR